jgi:elongation factor P
MIPVTELRAGAIFKDNGDPFQVLKYQHKKLGRGKANIRIKAKNLRTGAILDKTFNSGAKVEEAEVSKKDVRFLYQDGEEIHFQDLENEQKLSLPISLAPDAGNFLSKNQEVKILIFEDEPLSVEIPPTVELKVKKTAPGLKGNSATNIYKPATLESGHKLQVPLFINEGETIKVNTETGKYISRVG